jgi:hypothetical protein
MSASVKSVLTLVVLLVILLGAGFWGWQAFTEPLPTAEEVPVCEDTRMPSGARVLPEQVTVSVYNASERTGLAGFTMELLLNEGFAEGESGNAPDGTDVTLAEVWAEDPDGPAAVLIQSYLGRSVEIREPPATLGPGVVVIVGEQFKRLRPGQPFVDADQEATVCVPTT